MSNYRQKIYAYLQAKKGGFNKKLDPFKRKVFIDFKDKIILEIGAGSGNNLPYYKDARMVFLAEPNLYNHFYINKTNEKLKLNIKITADYAEKISLEDNSVDIVICNFVLCSVVDITKVLCEIIRVLKPNGRFIFIEHVASEKGLSKILQKICKLFWKFISSGCDCYNQTRLAFKNFENVMKFEYEIIYDVPDIFLKPWIIGMARRK